MMSTLLFLRDQIRVVVLAGLECFGRATRGNQLDVDLLETEHSQQKIGWKNVEHRVVLSTNVDEGNLIAGPFVSSSDDDVLKVGKDLRVNGWNRFLDGVDERSLATSTTTSFGITGENFLECIFLRIGDLRRLADLLPHVVEDCRVRLLLGRDLVLERLSTVVSAHAPEE